MRQLWINRARLAGLVVMMLVGVFVLTFLWVLVIEWVMSR